jgi:hypothetical protein
LLELLVGFLGDDDEEFIALNYLQDCADFDEWFSNLEEA